MAHVRLDNLKRHVVLNQVHGEAVPERLGCDGVN